MLQCTSTMKQSIDLKYKRELVQLFKTAAKRNISEEFIDYLLSLAEINEISTRIQILKLLLEGKNQREIAKRFSVGLTTVSRGARALKEHRKTIEKLGLLK